MSVRWHMRARSACHLGWRHPTQPSPKSRASSCWLPWVQDKAHLVERRARQEDACLIRARSRDLAEAPCQYGRARWLLIGGLLVSACVMLLGTLGVAPFAAPLRSVGRHFNHASTGEVRRGPVRRAHAQFQSCNQID